MTSRSEELSARAPLPTKKAEEYPEILETDDRGRIERIRTDIPEGEYNRTERGEAALNEALERGRQMRDAAMEKAAPLLANLRSRISNFATRALSVFKTSLGLAGEVKDVAGNTWEAGKDVARHMPEALAEAGKFAYEDVIAGTARGIKEGVLDLVNPAEIDHEKLGDIDVRLLKINEALSVTRGTEARVALDKERQRLEAEREEVLNPPQSQRKGAKLAKRAGGAVAGAGLAVAGGAAAIGMAGYDAAGRGLKTGKEYIGGKMDEAGEYVVDKIVAGAELAMEKEEKYLGIGVIASEALSKITGKEIKLTRAQAISLGASIDAAGLAGKFFEGVAEVGGAVLMVDDIAEVVKGNGQALKWAYSMVANAENRAWLAGELKQSGIDIATEMGKVAQELGSAAWEGTKSGAATVGRGVKTVGKGAAYAGAGVAALAAAPIVAPVAAAGLAGYGAYKAGEAGIAKARDVWKEVEPEVQARINVAIEGAKADWKRAEPGIIDGIASTVAPAIQLAANIYDVPADLKREVGREVADAKEKVKAGVVELNRIGAETVTFVERMRQRVSEAMDIARRAWNDMRRSLVGEDLMAENPEIVAGIDRAIDAVEEIENLPENAIEPLEAVEVPKPRNAKPIIRQVRGPGAA
jgi:hypothetical protein